MHILCTAPTVVLLSFVLQTLSADGSFFSAVVYGINITLIDGIIPFFILEFFVIMISLCHSWDIQ